MSDIFKYMLRDLLDQFDACVSTQFEARDEHGYLPLHKARTKKHVVALVYAGAKVNCFNKYNGKTPLHTVSNSEAVKELIKAGADVNARDFSGTTPIMRVQNIKTAALLMKNGADVNAANDYGDTALHSVQNPDCIQLLIDAGANIEARNNMGRTPLFNNTLAITECLLRNGANVNVKDNDGHNVLHMRLRYHLYMFLMAGVDVDREHPVFLFLHFFILITT